MLMFLFAETHWEKAFEAYARNDVYTVKRLLKKELDENNAVAHFMVGSCSNPEDAETVKHWEKSGDNPYALNSLGVYYMEKGDYKKAEEYLKKSYNKGCRYAASNLGSLYQKMGRLDESTKILKKDVKNGSLISAFLLGQNYLKTKNFEDGYMWTYIASDYLKSKKDGLEHETKKAKDYITAEWAKIEHLGSKEERDRAIAKAKKWLKGNPEHFVTTKRVFEEIKTGLQKAVQVAKGER